MDFAHRFNAGSASNRHAGESRHPDFMLVALRLDSGFRRNDESKAAAELVGKVQAMRERGSKLGLGHGRFFNRLRTPTPSLLRIPREKDRVLLTPKRLDLISPRIQLPHAEAKLDVKIRTQSPDTADLDAGEKLLAE
jgi:hypothetical protein